MSKTKFEVDKDNLEVRISRVFDCTPQRLWKAHTDPAEIVKWWSDTKIDKYDFRVGGQWRFVGGVNDLGQQNAFRGEYKEIDEPKKYVRTFEYEPYAGAIMLETVVFEPTKDTKTKLTTISKYQSLAHLEGMVNSGMERGATAGYERLAKVVETKG